MSDHTVYLIGGPSGGGKTTLGRALGQHLGLGSLTIDDLRTAVLGVTSPETHPDLHRIGLPNHIEYFTLTSPEQMIDDAIAQHAALWPAIERVILKRARFGPGMVIDGWHLIPDLVAGLAASNVRALWLDVAPDVLETREKAIWDFYARSDDPELMFSNFMGRSVRWNDLVSNEAKGLGLRVIDQDGSKSPQDLCSEILDAL